MNPVEFNTVLGDCARDIAGPGFLDFVLRRVDLGEAFSQSGVETLGYSEGAEITRRLAEKCFGEYQNFVYSSVS